MKSKFIFLLFTLFFAISCKNKKGDSSTFVRNEDSLILDKKRSAIANNPTNRLARYDSLISVLKQKKQDVILTRAYRDLHFLYDANDSIRKKSLYEAAKITTQNKDKIILSLYYSMLGRENLYYGDRKKSFEYCLKALELSKNKDEGNYVNTLSDLKFFSIEVMDYETAISYQKLWQAHVKNEDNKVDMLTGYYVLASMYSKKRDTAMMKKYIDSANSLMSSYNLKEKFPISGTMKGRYEVLKGNYEKALMYYNKNLVENPEIAYEINVDKLKVFEYQKKIDSINFILKRLKKDEKFIFGDRDVGINYYPLVHDKNYNLLKINKISC